MARTCREKIYLRLLCSGVLWHFASPFPSTVPRPKLSRWSQGGVLCRGTTVPDAFPFDPFAGGEAPPTDQLVPLSLSRFLTQRAVQQQLYYYDLNMDETHSTWLGEFLRPENCSRVHVDYHGINALPTSDSTSYLGAMLTYPEIEVKIKKPMGCASGRGRGGTGMGDYNRNSNPYLKPRFFEYTEVIRPLKVATSLLTIREQIAIELAEDLAFLVKEDEGTATDGGAVLGQNAPNGETTSQGGGRSSPFRLANYDLLKQLATKEALAKLSMSGSSSAKAVSSSYIDRLNSHNIWTHGRDEPSLSEEVLAELRRRDERAATQLVKERCRLAKSWREKMVPVLQQEQTSWKRWHMTRSFSVAEDVPGALGEGGLGCDPASSSNAA